MKAFLEGRAHGFRGRDLSLTTVRQGPAKGLHRRVSGPATWRSIMITSVAIKIDLAECLWVLCTLVILLR